MTYLILGANGLIGQQVAKQCQNKHIDYVGTCYSRTEKNLIHFDQLEIEKIPGIFDHITPTVVINCIGLSGGVNFCEENPEIGRKYHVDAVQTMVDWCAQNNAAYVYISTDYVFDGKNPPYKENDQTNPLNLYGHFKLEGEEYIQTQLQRYIIARTTNVFGWDPNTQTPNFLMHLVRTLEENDTIEVPAFLYGNPTPARDLAAGIIDLLDHRHYGLFHIVGNQNINRFQWALKFIEMAQISGKNIKKITTPPPNMVPRPLNSHLDNTKFKTHTRTKLHTIEESLQLFITTMNHSPKKIKQKPKTNTK